MRSGGKDAKMPFLWDLWFAKKKKKKGRGTPKKFSYRTCGLKRKEKKKEREREEKKVPSNIWRVHTNGTEIFLIFDLFAFRSEKHEGKISGHFLPQV